MIGNIQSPVLTDHITSPHNCISVISIKYQQYHIRQTNLTICPSEGKWNVTLSSFQCMQSTVTVYVCSWEIVAPTHSVTVSGTDRVMVEYFDSFNF